MSDKFFIVSRRFLKGLLAVAGAFSIQFLLSLIPQIVQTLPSVVNSPVAVALYTAILLALEKALQPSNQ